MVLLLLVLLLPSQWQNNAAASLFINYCQINHILLNIPPPEKTMDDYSIPSLNDSRNEWCERLIYILVPHINEGIRSIFNESIKMCVENNESAKYLMTFQNLLSKIPKWNSVIIQEEVERIIQKSGCNYISDLIACVHIIQLKVLTCVRVGNKQKKIDISIPKLDHFIHSIYIHVARKLYTNIYLFEKTTLPLQTQKNNRDIELIIRECVLTTIRESIPTEQIVRAYLDESVEHEDEIIVENIDEPATAAATEGGGGDKIADDANATTKVEENTKHEDSPPPIVPTISNMDNVTDEPTVTTTTLKFNDIDYVMDDAGRESTENAPKTIERLEEISMSNSIKRKLEEEEDDEGDEKLKIHDDIVDLGNLDIFDITNGGDLESPKSSAPAADIPLLDVEELF